MEDHEQTELLRQKLLDEAYAGAFSGLGAICHRQTLGDPVKPQQEEPFDADRQRPENSALPH